MEMTSATLAGHGDGVRPRTDPRASAAAGVPPPGLPWPTLLVLGGATLVMVTGEMLPTAVLPQMSAGLGVTQARTGMLVSIWAAVVVLASFPLVRITRRWDRRTVITASMIAFAGSAAATALAPSYHVALGGRLIGAAAVGLLWSTVNAHVADLVPDRLLGPATAVVLGGATLGMVLGTPVGRIVADAVTWRAAFWMLAGIGIVVAGLIRAVVAGSPDRSSCGSQKPWTVPPGRDSRSAWSMVTVAGLVAVALVGHYGVYTYVTALAAQPARQLPGGMGTVLLVFGVSSAIGVALAGRVRVHTGDALVVSIGATAAAVAGLLVAVDHAVAGIVVVVVWGVTSGALAPLAQTVILRLGGAERRALAGALVPVVFNGGIAVGAAVASALVATSGPEALPVPAAIVVAVAAAGLAVAGRRRSYNAAIPTTQPRRRDRTGDVHASG